MNSSLNLKDLLEVIQGLDEQYLMRIFLMDYGRRSEHNWNCVKQKIFRKWWIKPTVLNGGI